MAAPQFGLWPPGSADGSAGLTFIASCIVDASTDTAAFVNTLDPGSNLIAITSFPGAGDFQIEIAAAIATYPLAVQWYPLLELQSDVARVGVGKMEPSGLGTGDLVLRVRIFDLAGAAAHVDRVTVTLCVNPG